MNVRIEVLSVILLGRGYSEDVEKTEPKFVNI
jgi:hypothetical protein